MYPGLTDVTSDALVNCLARKEMEAGSQRASRSPRMRPGGAGDAAEDTLVGFVTEQMIMEELTKTDKAEIKTIVRKELEKELKAKLAKAVEEEVAKALKDKSTKEEIGEISKKIIKKLYKDLSLHHPYIIDRIKV